jgi:hypothetical protein
MKKQLIKHIYKTNGLNRGIKYNNITKKYNVYIQKDKKCYYVGTYKTNEEAGMAYDLKAIEIYGDDAITNYKHHKGITIKEYIQQKNKKRLSFLLNKINKRLTKNIYKIKKYSFNKIKGFDYKNENLDPDIFVKMTFEEKLIYLRTGKIL